MRICIYGAGAIGGYMGVLLSRAGAEVSLVARGAHLEAMQRNGVKLRLDDDEHVAHPRCTNNPAELGPQDLVIIALKAHSIPAAVPALHPLLGNDTAILTDEFVQMRWESATDPSAPADIKKLYNRAMLEGMRRGRAFGAVDAVSVLTKIKAPTLVMFGRDDRVTPMDGSLAAMRLIPKCELHVFYDCGHWAMIERKDEFESTVLAFLARDRKDA